MSGVRPYGDYEWVCSRCAKDLFELGRRFRFANEKCPRCNDPGCGMVMVERNSK